MYSGSAQGVVERVINVRYYYYYYYYMNLKFFFHGLKKKSLEQRSEHELVTFGT